MRPTVSIVIPTLNRISRLQRGVNMIRDHLTVTHEIIVVDGGSTDGTRAWLAEEHEVRVILEAQREGAVRAFNKGFRAATGEFVMWLNDDAFVLPGSIEAALAMLQRDDLPGLGMVAFYHNMHQPRNELHATEHEGERYCIYHVRGHLYANFGLLRRELLKKVGFFDDRYYFFAADPDLSLKLQRQEGLEVLGCPGAFVHHDELHDDRKLSDLPQGREDNAKLFVKWNLPPPGQYPDPKPDYLRRIQAHLQHA